MKKILSILLSCIILLSATGLCAFAVPLSAGMGELNAQFPDGKSSNSVSYVYFSPKKGEGDTSKYPLMIWLHGIAAAGKQRNQLTRYDLGKWASDEYQSRFGDLGGCFVFAPLSPNALTAWDSTQTDALKTAIDGFVARFSGSIDTNRIYIGGFSLGACMVWSMLSAYPDYFAAALPMAAIYQPTIDYSSIKDVSLWMFTCDRDSYAGGTTAASRGTFNSMKAASSNPENLRFTNLANAKLPDYSNPGNQHFIWGALCNDMHMNDGSAYAGSRTVDCYGNEVNFSTPEVGVISWLAEQCRENDSQPETKLSFWDKLMSFFKKIAEFISNLFS